MQIDLPWFSTIIAIIVQSVGIGIWTGIMNSNVRHLQSDIRDICKDIRDIKAKIFSYESRISKLECV